MNPMTIRINPKNESDLYQFVKSKGGIKKAVNHLFNHYQMTKDIQSMLDGIVERPRTTIKVKELVPDEEVNMMMSNFIK